MKQRLAQITRRIDSETLTTGPAGFFPEELRRLLKLIRAAGPEGLTSHPLRNACRAMRRALETDNPLPEELRAAGVTCSRSNNSIRYKII